MTRTATAFAASLLAGTAMAQVPPAKDPLPVAGMAALNRGPSPEDKMAAAGWRLTYLGMLGDQRGYLAAQTDGTGRRRFQAVYVDPATGQVYLGEVFGADGSNMTERQMASTYERLSQLERSANATSPDRADDTLEDKAPSTQESRQPPAAPSETATPEAAAPPAGRQPAGIPAATPDVPGAGAPRPLPAQTIPKETFLAAVGASTAKFHCGRLGAPIVYLVTDTDCEPCHRAWDALRPMVTTGKIDVVVIVTSQAGHPEDRALSLLSQRQGTSLAWYEGQGSTGDQDLMPPPPPPGSDDRRLATQYLRLNQMFARDLGIARLPALAYEDRQGGWHMQQDPQDMAAVIESATADPPRPAAKRPTALAAATRGKK